ncbi:hypothetical protein ABZY57_17985 [Streptomyces sp. NPDC006450]|uniref:hypothetical protein n=1 Tax=Streptomyces sp. NPDC006450 TaxID=3155458 RepID=UPI00339EA6E7
MNEDRTTNEDEEQVLPGLSGGSASGGPEALRELLRAKPSASGEPSAPVTSGAAGCEPDGTGPADAVADGSGPATTEPAVAEPATTEPAVAEPAAADPAAAELAPVRLLASEPVGEEDVLRDLLRGVVGGLEPSSDALERLRYAVPARRVRNRRILVAAAAAVVVLGGSVPVGLHLASGSGGSSDRSVMAGHGQKDGDSKDGSGLHQNGSSRPKPKRSSDKDKDKDKDGENGGASASPAPADGRFPSIGGPDAIPPRAPSALPGTPGTVGGGLIPPPASSDVPNCTQSQVGVEGSTRAPSAGGKVYGSFKVTNVSGRGCTVRGPETLTAGPASQGGAAVAVVSHVTGDPATGLLPDPSVEALRMVLAPNASYEVRFAWVPPEGGCPVADGSGEANTPEGGSGGAPDTGTGQTRAETPPLGAVVSHTPNTSGPDGPTTHTTIAEACGGTVYRTGVIPIR